MGLFPKEQCCFCGNSVGFFKRKKLINNQGYVCSECEKKISSNLPFEKVDKAFLEKTMAYFEKQGKLYNEAFAPIDKKQKHRFGVAFTGVVFADDIAMFEFESPKAKKKDYKELIRYDMIQSYDIYTVANSDPNAKGKYSEVGVDIKLKSTFKEGELNAIEEKKDTAEVSEDVKNAAEKIAKAVDAVAGFHPYISKLRVPCANNTDSTMSAEQLVDYMDKLFGKYVDDSLVGGIKEKFTGTQKERDTYSAIGKGLGALGSMAKAKITGNEEDAAKAQEKMDAAKDAGINLATGNSYKYREIADKAEEKVFGAPLSF